MSDLYVSTSGSASNSGTVSSPTTLTAAITKVTAGGTIYMMSGTYTYDSQLTIERGNDGASGSYKSIMPYNSGAVILDFSSQTYGDPSSVTNPRGLQINGNYWHIKGLAVKGAADNGIYIGGSYNKIELCETYENRDSGLQLGRYISTAAESDWPANNEILNCTSHDNSDPDNGEDADGFACKLTTGEGNVFRGCISYNNVDDGWDLYTKSATGAIGAVTIEGCVAFNNGVTSDGTSTANSDGNGFKLGGDKISVNHIVQNCIAFNNKKHGFTYNSNPGSIALTNCTSYNNGTTSGSNFAFDKGTHVFTNLLSYIASSSDKTSGPDVNNSNVWWKNKKSTNANGLVCSDADFVSLTPTVTRNSDGSINFGTFLQLATDSDLIGAGTPSGTNIGAR
ncbi:right-handed parallel beta-helix repeat-containing protein [Pelosinus fermentans]|uniref:Pectate disaccharide-lyase n=1 Tax=Pelosinus fermentans JBW45 TaxID=1192197 RepID=I8TMD1_9FIRM|nr:right-handed parallel beta-helix repeat-containing protein [Pelosinus fermentans]AJQ25521.1 Pectate disaccharide-lyase [Pelosinus fermentans JBW45]